MMVVNFVLTCVKQLLKLKKLKVELMNATKKFGDDN